VIHAQIRGEETIPEALRGKFPAVMEALARRMTYLALRLQQKIVTEKLSGQVLAHRSGKLAGSIVAYPAEEVGTRLVARVEGATPPAQYGIVHEFGGAKTYVINPVNKKALRFMVGGKVVFAKYVFHPPLPKRAFMAPALEEMRDEILESLRQAVGEGLSS
jgi:hypothetical protein